jgi:hypothetical protein
MDVGTARQWAETGISPGQLRTMVRRGQLVRQRYGTYATASAVAAAGDDDARLHALNVRAVLAGSSRGDAVASHESAALVHALPLLKPPSAGVVSITRPPGSYRGRSVPDVRCYSAALPPEHVTTEHDVPLTTVTRTIIDLARALPFMDAVVVADQAIRALRTSKSQLAEAIKACPGWPGLDRARRVTDFSNGWAESPLESCARVVFDAYGLPAPELQAAIPVGVHVDADGTVTADDYHDFRADFLWRDARTVAETDGLMKYSTGQEAIKERQRDRLLREAGYKVVHITWAELFNSPQRIIDRIQDAFQARSPY